jgi:hypothetical protein
LPKHSFLSSLLFGLIEIEEVSQLVTSTSAASEELISTTPHPRIQLQLMEILWRLNFSIGSAHSISATSQQFVADAHQMMTAINRVGKPIKTFRFKSYTIPSEKLILPGSMDIGAEDMILCCGETIDGIPFKSIGCLEADSELDLPTISKSINSMTMFSIGELKMYSGSSFFQLFFKNQRREDKN